MSAIRHPRSCLPPVQLPSISLAHQCISGTGVGVRYQPIFNAQQELSGFEALARLQSGGQAVPMGEIIGQVRDSGLLPALGRHVHRRALRDFGEQARGVPPHVRLSLNASAEELCLPQFVPTLITSIVEAKVAPSRVVVELTEDMTLPDVAAATKAILELQASGICVSLDDFGAGANGFVAMRRLPVGQIKLDRSLIQDANAQDILVAGIISIAHDMGMEVVAEGIETQSQHDLMAELGCDLFQGFLLGRPAPLSAALPR